MVALGVAGALAGLPPAALEDALRASWKRSAEALAPNLAALQQGVKLAQALDGPARRPWRPAPLHRQGRWLLSGNEAAGCGALRGGVRFVAAYPITPATELLEWMAPALSRWAAACCRPRTSWPRST
jgi:2-oxoglutarate ferredoxin oxidoreductase subunit alpha